MRILPTLAVLTLLTFAIPSQGLSHIPSVSSDSSIDDATVRTIDGNRICFSIKGNQKSLVEIGIGSKPGTGSCCEGLSGMSSGRFCGEVGDVVYDGKTNRVLFQITSDIEGKTIELQSYY